MAADVETNLMLCSLSGPSDQPQPDGLDGKSMHDDKAVCFAAPSERHLHRKRKFVTRLLPPAPPPNPAMHADAFAHGTLRPAAAASADGGALASLYQLIIEGSSWQRCAATRQRRSCMCQTRLQTLPSTWQQWPSACAQRYQASGCVIMMPSLWQRPPNNLNLCACGATWVRFQSLSYGGHPRACLRWDVLIRS